MRPAPILLALLCAVLAAAEPAPGDACAVARPMAWCHYVAWYHPADPQQVAGRFYDQPLAAPDADRVAARRGEVAAALAAGIDGFLVDLVGGPKPRRTGYVADVEELLAAAAGTPFLVGGCLDVAHPDLDWQVEELAAIAARLGRHPNYPRVDGRPLFATYGAKGRSTAQWRQVRDGLRARGVELFLVGDLDDGFARPDAATVAERAAAFDLLYKFSAYPHRPPAGQAAWSTAETFARLGGSARAAGRAWMAPLWPGYLGAWLNGRNDYHQPFRGLDVLWECGLALDPGREAWAHLCTWNDHDETTLAPTAIAGDGRLALVAAVLRRWRGLPPAQEAPRVLAAYHREELIGTTLRIEVASLPGRAGGRLAVAGALRDPQGAVLAELPERILAGDAFARAEWLVPTAALGGVAAWTPELAVRRDDGPAAPPVALPAVLPVQGWLQNGGTVVAALDRCAAGSARLAVAVDADGQGTATLAVDADQPVRAATLWRNDRCLAAFAAGTPDSELHVVAASLRRHRLDLAVAGGALVAANRRGGLPAGSATAGGLGARHDHDWAPLGLVLAGGADLALRVRVDGGAPQTVARADLLAGRTLTVDGAVALRLAEADPRGVAAAAPPGSVSGSGPLAARLWMRALRSNDRFAARVELVSGQVLWSPVVAPFSGAGPVDTLPVLDTDDSIECARAASGTLGERGFLAPPPPRAPVVVDASVHPAARRAAAWRLSEAWDALGDRPLPALLPADQGALRLSGSQALRLPARLVPLGAGTLRLRLRPDALGEEQAVLVRDGWASAMSLRLRADGRLALSRDGDGIAPAAVLAERPLEAGRWTAVQAACDERTLRLWLDGVPAGAVAIAPGRAHGNATYRLGADTGGFRGAVADLAILGWAEAPAP